MLLEINHHTINLEDHGEQHHPGVVLLHHGLGSLAAWRKQVPALVAAGFRALPYDRWGYGDSEFRLGIDMPAFTQDLADLLRLLDVLKLGQVTLVGHSDGGTIAMYFAMAHPERVRCMVIIAGHVYIEPKMRDGILGVWHDFQHDQRFRIGLRRAHGVKFEQTFHNWFDGWTDCECQGWNMCPLLASITCPVLVVQGDADEHATSQHAIDTAAAIPGADLWLVPGGRHMLPQESAELLNPRLIEFINKAKQFERMDDKSLTTR